MALKTGAKRHIHKYHFVSKQWHCALSDCTHFMPGNVAGNILGKKSICWNCGKEFLLDEESLKNEKPQCIFCSNEVAAKDVTAFLEQLENK